MTQAKGFTGRQVTYLALSLVGLCATWYFNLRFLAAAGGSFDLVAFVKGGYANNASSSLSNDLWIGCTTFLVWSYAEARRLAMRRWWVYPVLTLSIAFAFTFPLFLFVRDRRLQAMEAPTRA